MNTARFTQSRAAHVLPAHGSAADHRSEVDLLAMLRTLWRGKWTILLVTFLAIALMLVYVSKVAVPLYTATSVVSLQNRQQQVVDIESVMTGIGSEQASVNTEVEVLRSRGLIRKLVDELGLLSDPEFNASLRPKTPWFWEPLLEEALGPGEPEPTPSPRVIRDRTVQAVLDTLAVNNVRQSYVFELQAETQASEKSSRIVDTLADLYIRDQVEVRFAATERATEWLTDRVAQLKSELDQAERAAQQFNSSIELISPERLEALNRQLKDFRDRYAGLRAQQAVLEERVATLNAARESGDYERMAAAANLPLAGGLQQPADTGAPADPQVFDNRFEQVLERARIEAERNALQLESMATSIASLEQQVSTQSREALTLEQMLREAEASRLIYEHFLGRLKEISVQEGIQQADARVLSYSMLPTSPSSPRTGILLPLSALIGMFAGAALVILREKVTSGFRTPEDLEHETGTTVIGQIPRAPYARRKRILDYISEVSNSAMSEAVRNLRTSILLSGLDQTPKVIMMTSSVPGEGKTTLSLALAHNLAGMGKKVLAIEGDIRKRTFDEIFRVKNQTGLLTVVSGEAPLEDVVYREERLGIDILFGGRANVNAADLFSSDRFAAFLKEARDAYDFIVIDTPPVLMVPDARVIARSSDVVIYVVRWDSTPRRQVAQGMQAFSTVNAPVNGLVLSQIDPRGMKRYGHSGMYGKDYRSHAKQYYES